MVIFPSLLILGSEELVQLSLQCSFLVCCSSFSSFVPLLCLREVSEREVSLDVPTETEENRACRPLYNLRYPHTKSWISSRYNYDTQLKPLKMSSKLRIDYKSSNGIMLKRVLMLEKANNEVFLRVSDETFAGRRKVTWFSRLPTMVAKSHSIMSSDQKTINLKRLQT